jgi:hypothetical protein
MDLPFTQEQFIALFATYNAAIWPAQIIMYVLGIVIVAGFFRPNNHRWGRIIVTLLGGMWLWTAMFYHLFYFSRINQAAVLFGTLFFFEGSVLFLNSTSRKKLNFHAAPTLYDIVGGILIFYAMAVYPVLGTMAGHGWPNGPMFGVAPCPVTIFTFGVLLMVKGRVALSILLIPFFWAIVGTSAAMQLGMYEDLGLTAAGVVGTALILYRNRTLYPVTKPVRRAQAAVDTRSTGVTRKEAGDGS